MEQGQRVELLPPKTVVEVIGAGYVPEVGRFVKGDWGKPNPKIRAICRASKTHQGGGFCSKCWEYCWERKTKGVTIIRNALK